MVRGVGDKLGAIVAALEADGVASAIPGIFRWHPETLDVGSSPGRRSAKGEKSMYMFKDPAPLTRAATIALWAYLVLNALTALGSLYLLPLGIVWETPAGLAVGLLALGTLLALPACFVLVGCWIYRANANAHSFSDYMSISPGGAIGWYFVPIANLFKPFQAMKETWLASHYPGNWHSEPVPSSVNWWWGLWIVTNILGTLSARMSVSAPEAGLHFVVVVDLVAAALNVPLCLILIGMMKGIAAAQVTTHHSEAFA